MLMFYRETEMTKIERSGSHVQSKEQTKETNTSLSSSHMAFFFFFFFIKDWSCRSACSLQKLIRVSQGFLMLRLGRDPLSCNCCVSRDCCCISPDEWAKRSLHLSTLLHHPRCIQYLDEPQSLWKCTAGDGQKAVRCSSRHRLEVSPV